jgi:hypothetical protein
MRNATSEIGSGGNSKIGVPVTTPVLPFFVHHITPCRALLVPPHTISHIPPTSSLAQLPEIVPSANPTKTFERTPCKRCGRLSLRVLMPHAFAIWLCMFSSSSHLISQPFPSDPTHTSLWPSPFSLPFVHDDFKARLTLIQLLIVPPQHHLIHPLPPPTPPLITMPSPSS